MSPHEAGADLLSAVFDAAYWRTVEQFCEHCGDRIKPFSAATNGWTHAAGHDPWGGIRCLGRTEVATPKGDDEQ